jgi:hypothetical protein
MSLNWEDIHSLMESDEAGVKPPPEMKEHEVWLYRHLAVAALLLEQKVPRYRELLAQWEAEGPTEELRADALYEAGALSVVLQSVRSRPEVLAAAAETPVKPTLALGALDQLFYSFTLLTSPSADDEYVEAKMSEEDLDEFLSFPQVQAWLREMGSEGPPPAG